MRTALFYDTETTGLPDFKAPSEAPHQPHLVQLGACLVDLDTRRTLQTLDVLVRPDGWVIPTEASDIHGITTEMAMDLGVSETMAVGMLMELWGDWRAAQTERVGHNESFDARIVRIALMRHESEVMADRWKAGKAQCTAILSTPIVNLPPTPKMVAAGFRKPKMPTLGEAYRFFTGRELSNAHSAIADVQGCMEVFFSIADGVREAA